MTDSASLRLPLAEYVERRARLSNQLAPGSVLLLRAASLSYRNRDAEYPFRQHSDFHYLSGFPEPDALLLLKRPLQGDPVSVLFVAPRDPAQEVWTGYRAGAEGAVERYGFDQGFTLDELEQQLPQLLANCEQIYYPFSDLKLAEQVQGWCRKLQAEARSSEAGAASRCDCEPLLHRMRLLKSEAEQQLMREAGRISAEAHCRAMRNCRPGLYEYQLEADIQHHFGRSGCRFAAYGTIVGGGANGCILHYTQNADRLNDGDLVLIDAGCEVDGYAGDITRTFPINGRFSDDQRALYQVVLGAQLAAIAAVKAGASFDAPHQVALRRLVDGLVELGLLQGEVDELIDSEAYKPFYMHRTSHWLGLDVHDVGDYRHRGKSQLLQPGMVLTIEPGLYIAPDNAAVEPRWRGIGIRIEDDVLVGEAGCEVLTDGVPKTIEAIEALMQVKGDNDD